MGVVYLARDPLIGRLVALKTFRIGYSVKDQEMEQFRIRFMREAQSAGILTHPNIVTIHDVVEASDEGLAFIAMEYVRGTNLKLLLQGDQPLSLAVVLDVIAQVGDALDYAHSNRVVHRDVKPANILITTDNRVKITDFGIARLDSSNLTQEGQLLGTPNYMAPEQIQGKEVDHRADLFSLGVVLYEMLTRHKPFQGENLTVVSHRIVYDHFTPPAASTSGTCRRASSRILDRALEKDPARRYQRAARDGGRPAPAGGGDRSARRPQRDAEPLVDDGAAAARRRRPASGRPPPPAAAQAVAAQPLRGRPSPPPAAAARPLRRGRRHVGDRRLRGSGSDRRLGAGGSRRAPERSGVAPPPPVPPARGPARRHRATAAGPRCRRRLSPRRLRRRALAVAARSWLAGGAPLAGQALAGRPQRARRGRQRERP